MHYNRVRGKIFVKPARFPLHNFARRWRDISRLFMSFCSAEGSRVRQALHDTDSFIKFRNFVFTLSGIRLSGTRVFYHAQRFGQT